MRTALLNSAAKLADGVKPNLARYEIVPADKQMPAALEAAGYAVNEETLADCKMSLGALIVDAGVDRGWWAAGTPNDPEHGNMNTDALYAWVAKHEKDGISDVGGTAKYQVLHNITSVEQLLPADVLLAKGHVAMYTGGIIDLDGNSHTGIEAAKTSKRKLNAVNGTIMLEWFKENKPGFVVLRIIASSSQTPQETLHPTSPNVASSTDADTIVISGIADSASSTSNLSETQDGTLLDQSDGDATIAKAESTSVDNGGGTLTIIDAGFSDDTTSNIGSMPTVIAGENEGSVTVVDLTNPTEAVSQAPEVEGQSSSGEDTPSIATVVENVEKQTAKDLKERLQNVRYTWITENPYEKGKLYHRSGSNPYALENSPEGIRYAIRHGYSRIDLDLQVTKDGVVVATHTRDPLRDDKIKGGFKDTSHTITDKKTEISEMTYAQVLKLKHSKGYTIRSLKELIQEANDEIVLFFWS
mgnify:FL=1